MEFKAAVSRYIREFHSTPNTVLEAIGQPYLTELVGNLTPVGKERVPLQTADLLCWHTARANKPYMMDIRDARRYNVIAPRKGHKEHIDTELVSQLAYVLMKPMDRP